MPSPVYRNLIRLAGAFGRYSLYGEGAPRQATLLIVSPVAGLSAYERTARELAHPIHGAPQCCYVLELPGGESTPRLPEKWTFAQYAEWVAAWMESVGLNYARALIGHSNSGPVAMELAARWPERVGHLLLVGSIGAEPRRSLFHFSLTYAQGVESEGTFPLRAFWVLLGNLIKQTTALWHQRGLALSITVESLAKRVQSPTTLLWGRHDHAAGLEAPHTLVRWLGGKARIVWSETGGHDWLIVQPQAFAQAVRDLLLPPHVI